jgi:Bacterial Ig-like domain (group 3)
MATVADCTISQNTSSDDGGGVDNDDTGSLTVNDSAIDHNSAEGFGGGLEANGTTSDLTLNDCTISSNTADKSGGGLSSVVAVTLTACTITGNTAAIQGGGLYNDGTATLTDTIIASNTVPASSSDIQGKGTVSGSFNLIGTGGAGGLTDGTDNNIVLSGTQTAGLAPLGSYGGPTQTIALLPGSLALGAGTAADFGGTTTPITTDQRGSNLDAPAPDIGAYQSQGFTLTLVGGTPQSTTINTSFQDPLTVMVTAKDPNEPVAGGVISFALPASGASAAILGDPTTIAANGEAFVTATANSSAGPYTVFASILGTTAEAEFQLTNLPIPTPTVAVSASTGSAVFGQSIILSATVSASAGPTPTGTITFFDGGTDLGIVALNGSGDATLTTSSLAIGANSITASYSGDSNFTDASSAQAATVSVAQAATQVVLIPMGPLRGRKVGLEAEIQPLAPGAGVPTGTVKFELTRKKFVIGPLSGGMFTLTTKLARVRNKTITILYSGDPDFLASTLTTKITKSSLVPMERPMVRLSTGIIATRRGHASGKERFEH